jgi:uncharacterized protein
MNMEFMKGDEATKLLKGVGLVLVLLAIFLAAQTISVFKDLRSPNLNYNSISVTGEGEILSVPDVASFSFTVSVDANEVAQAQTEVTTKINNILDGLKSLGIEEKDIKTSDYSVWPRYRYVQEACSGGICPPGRQVSDGFTVSHNITVKVRDTAKAGEALAMVGDNGGTNISGINFTADDPDALYVEAREKAIVDAKEKAKALSKNLGVKLVRVVDFYDNTAQQPIPYAGNATDVEFRVSSQAAPTIPTGENKTKVVVTIRYEIR